MTNNATSNIVNAKRNLAIINFDNYTIPFLIKIEI